MSFICRRRRRLLGWSAREVGFWFKLLEVERGWLILRKLRLCDHLRWVWSTVSYCGLNFCLNDAMESWYDREDISPMPQYCIRHLGCREYGVMMMFVCMKVSGCGVSELNGSARHSTRQQASCSWSVSKTAQVWTSPASQSAFLCECIVVATDDDDVCHSCLRTGGTAAAAPPPFTSGNPALCGSRPLVILYYCRLGDSLCFVFMSAYCMFNSSVCYLFLQYFDTVGWVFCPSPI